MKTAILSSILTAGLGISALAAGTPLDFGDSDELLIADFSDGATSLLGGDVYTYNDGDDGGLSIIESSIVDGRLHIDFSLDKGKLSYDPFIGAGINLSTEPMDLSRCAELRFAYKVTGNVKTFDLQLVPDIKEYDMGYAYHYQSVRAYGESWDTALVTLDYMKQPSWIKSPYVYPISEVRTSTVAFEFKIQAKTGYTGSLEIDDITCIRGTASYYVEFHPDIYNWKNYESNSWLEGSTPEYYGETPTLESTAQYSFTFRDWGLYRDTEPYDLIQEGVSAVTGPATYVALFDTTINEYTVKFVDYDGTVLGEVTYPYGTFAPDMDFPDDPVRESEDGVDYSFNDWIPSTPVKYEIYDYERNIYSWKLTQNVTMLATYTSTHNGDTLYTVTFMYGPDILQTGEYSAGETPEYFGETPTKEPSATELYTFWGWEDQNHYCVGVEVCPVSGNTVYTPIFDSETRYYTITFLDDDGTLLGTQQLPYGDWPSFYGSTKDEYMDGVSLRGWEPERVAVVGDATYQAEYNYRVCFEDDEGNEFDCYWFPQGFVPSYEETPTKASTAEYNYEFIGWDKEFDPITEPTVYTAYFAAVPIPPSPLFEITDGERLIDDFQDGDEVSEMGTDWFTYDDLDYGYGSNISQEIVLRDSGNYAIKFTYSRDAWVGAGIPMSVDGAVDFSQCNAIMYDYRGGDHDFRIESPYGSGDDHFRKSMPASDEWTTAEFYWSEFHNSGDATVSMVQKHVTQFVFDLFGDGSLEIDNVICQNKPSYKIKFYDSDETTLLDSAVFAQGETPVYNGWDIEDVDLDSAHVLRFAGWTPEIVPATSDMVYTAMYDTSMKTVSVNVYDTERNWYDYEVVYGSIPEYDGPEITMEPDESCEEYVQDGWEYYAYATDDEGFTQEFLPATGDISYYPSFTCVKERKFVITFLNDNGDTLKMFEKKYGDYLDEDEVFAGKPWSAKYEYEFMEWTPEVENYVYESATYTAVYDTTIRKHSVRFVDYDGNTIYVDGESYMEYPYGTKFSEIVTPDPDIMVRESDGEVTYTFAGWIPSITEDDSIVDVTTFVANYTASNNTYTVVFMQDTYMLWSQEYALGDTVVYEGPTPSRPEFEYATYTWDENDGWDKPIEPVTGPAVYTAKFQENWKTYEVVFLNDDGTELYRNTYPYGTEITDAPTAEEVLAGKDSLARISSAGWVNENSSEGLHLVTEDMTYYADVEYGISLYVGDDKSLGTEWFKLGVDLHPVLEFVKEYIGDEITKASTVQYDYTWNGGWTPEVVNVTGSASYTATFDSTLRQYKVTFVKDTTGKLLMDPAYYDYGTKAEDIVVPTEIPTKEPTEATVFTFAGWNLADVTGNAVYMPTFTASPRQYKVAFLTEAGDTITSTLYDYGTDAGDVALPTAPAKANFKFAGWIPEVETVWGDAAYTATYIEDNKFVVVWRDDDGTLLEQQAYKTGETPKYPGDDPVKEPSEEFTYAFSGWTPAIVEVTKDAEYTAAYKETVRKYPVKFVNYDGTELSSAEYAYGTPSADIEKPENPEKPSNERYSYTFIGWTPSIEDVTEEATYTAQYVIRERTFKVVFEDVDGDTWDIRSYRYGESIFLPSYGPDKETESCVYEFIRWTSEYTDDIVKEDRVFTAQVSTECNVKTYYVEFYDPMRDDWTGRNYEYGTKAEDIKLPSIPEYDDVVEECTYSAVGWDPEIADVTENVTYVAQYEKHCYSKPFVVTWLNEDGTTLEQQNYAEDEVPTYEGKTPTKKSTAQKTYEFAGWTPTVVAVTGDAQYTAVFKESPRMYTVKFLNYDGSVLSSTTYAYGTGVDDIAVPEVPEREPDGTNSYTFTGWSSPIRPVTQNATYKAQFSTEVRVYTVTFKDDDGTVLGTVEYGYNDLVDLSYSPQKATVDCYYEFDKWVNQTGTSNIVKSDMEYVASYSSECELRQYGVQFYDPLSKIKTAEELYDYGTPAEEIKVPNFEASVTIDDCVYELSGWNPKMAEVTGDVVYEATYDMTCAIKQYTITWLDEDGTEIYSEVLDEETMPEYKGKTPTKESTVENNFTFSGWTPEVVAVAKNAEYKAVFKATTRQYVITFVNDTGAVISATSYDYGTDATEIDVPVAPTKTGYIFEGWEPAMDEYVAGDVTYKPTYSRAKYTVTYLDASGKTWHKDTYSYGAKIIARKNEFTKEDFGCTYEPAGWSPEVATTVTEDVTYEPQFTCVPKNFVITFVALDGDTMMFEYPYGTKAEKIELPAMADTLIEDSLTACSFTFLGWGEISDVKDVATYVAQYDSVCIDGLVTAGVDALMRVGFARNTLSIALESPSTVRVQIFDLTGHLQDSFSEYIAGSRDFDLSRLTQGSYIVRVTSKSLNKTTRIVIK